MANELQKITPENCTPEQLVQSKLAKNLAENLTLSETQIAKGNHLLLEIFSDSKLKDATNVSKLRYCYKVAQLNYKNDKAVVPVQYGKEVAIQFQYYAFIEDIIESGIVEPKNIKCVELYEGIDYQPYLDNAGNKVLIIPEKIELKDMFTTPKIIGYYASIETNDGELFTALMSKEDLERWALKYSISYKSYKNGRASSAIWATDFNAMANKTVIKQAAREFLKKHPLDRLALSLATDQLVCGTNTYEYKDNPTYKEAQSRENTTVNNTILDLTTEEKEEDGEEEQREN